MSTVCLVCRRRGASRETNLCAGCEPAYNEGLKRIADAKAAAEGKSSKSKKGKD